MIWYTVTISLTTPGVPSKLGECQEAKYLFCCALRDQPESGTLEGNAALELIGGGGRIPC